MPRHLAAEAESLRALCAHCLFLAPYLQHHIFTSHLWTETLVFRLGNLMIDEKLSEGFESVLCKQGFKFFLIYYTDACTTRALDLASQTLLPPNYFTKVPS